MTDWMRNLPAELPEQLAETYDELQARKEALIEAIGRMPASCNDDETATKMTDFIGQMMACINQAKKAHKLEKEPHLRAGQAVDKFFRDIASPLEMHKAAIEQIVGSYQFKKQEAIKLAALAAAQAAGEATEEQAAIVAARPLELSRLHGDLATGSLKTVYDFTLEDINLVPRKFLQLNESAIKAYIHASSQDTAPEPIPGLRFIARHVTRVRS